MTKKETAVDLEKEQPQDEIVPDELSPGTQLSARRQSLNWSVEQVAGQLNLAPRQIQAIEADNYAALPGMATARGFVRAYAKLLNVDAAPLLQAIAKEATTGEEAGPLRRELPNIRFTESRLAPQGRPNVLWRLVLGVFLLVLLAGGIFAMQQSDLQEKLPSFFQFGTGNAPTVLVPLDQKTVIDEDPGTMLGEAEKVGADSGAIPGPGDNEANRDIVANQLVANGSMPSAQTGAAGDISVTAAAASGTGTKDMLTLILRQDSWVEIRRADNSTVVAALLKAGTTESFKITGPVVMTVGNAAGVDATLGGKKLALNAHTKTNVARINLK